MANTYIDTNKLPHTKTPGGEYVEVLNNALCGAKNVVGTLRWLKAGEKYDAASDARTNQLIYLMEGEATITLNAKSHDVAKGNGIYLGPSESASIAQRGTAPLKLFQLVVPKQGA
jgi:mannose-6-phosphate isomerase-like protein (cupin superfamily)